MAASYLAMEFEVSPIAAANSSIRFVAVVEASLPRLDAEGYWSPKRRATSRLVGSQCLL